MKLNTDNNNRILIRNGTVWDGNALYKSDILICGGIIAKISKSIDESADFCFDAENNVYYTPAFRKTNNSYTALLGVDSMICALKQGNSTPPQSWH